MDGARSCVPFFLCGVWLGTVRRAHGCREGGDAEDLACADSLKCADCHVPEGRIDFVALGYSEEQATKLAGLAAPEREEAEAPTETPETGGMPLMPGWMAATLIGLAALTTGAVVGRFRQ